MKTPILLLCGVGVFKFSKSYLTAVDVSETVTVVFTQ